MSKKPSQGQKIDTILALVTELANRPDGAANAELMNLMYGVVARYGVKVPPGNEVFMVAQIPMLQMPDTDGLIFDQQPDGTVMVSIVRESPASPEDLPSDAPQAEAGEVAPGQESDEGESDTPPPASTSPAPAPLTADDLVSGEDDPEVAVDMTPGL